MSKYDYSKQINLWLTSDSDIYQRLVLALNEKIKQELMTNGVNDHEPIKRFKIEEHEKALRYILADLFVTFSNDPKRYLAFSRNNTWYSTATRYQPKRFSPGPFTNVVDALTSLGYIESIKGYNDKSGNNGRISRMIATDKLIKLFKKLKITTTDFKSDLNRESIILKTPKGSKAKTKKINYTDTPEASLMRNNLKQINENIGKHWIDLRITDTQFGEIQAKLIKDNDKYKHPVDFTRTNMFRIFNNGDESNPKFNQGGRFYGGWWLSLPSEYRSRITINGKKTIELDYSTMHFYMMYAEKNLPIPDGDLYTVDRIDRSKAKKALNIALNASSKTKSITAIKENHWPKKSRKEVTEILDKLLKKHEAISEFFFTGKGVELQFKDSQIAESVMLNIWKEWGEAVLPVHDSFIIRASLIDKLKGQMNKSFKEITGYNSKMKPKKADELLKSSLDKKAQRVDYDEDGNITGLGVNAADTYDDYKQEQKDYSGYLLRQVRWEYKE